MIIIRKPLTYVTSKFLGSHYNNYGSTTTKRGSENGSHLNLPSNGKMDNGLLLSSMLNNGQQQLQRGAHPHLGSSSTLTLRSNQLAALDDMDGNRDASLDYDYDVDYDEDIYHEASTLPINNATIRTRNRRVSQFLLCS